MPRLVHLRRIIGFLLLGGSLALNSARGQTVYNGTTVPGDLVIAPSATVTFTGGASFTGANASLGNYSTYYWNQNGTLASKAITFGSCANYQIIDTS